jgi:hypothetical protein
VIPPRADLDATARSRPGFGLPGTIQPAQSLAVRASFIAEIQRTGRGRAELGEGRDDITASEYRSSGGTPFPARGTGADGPGLVKADTPRMDLVLIKPREVQSSLVRDRTGQDGV